MIALFIAGGSGTILWPISRENNPKQLHKFVNGKSLISQTIDRITPLIARQNVWLVCGQKHLQEISENCPDVPVEQIISEPFPLGTNLAVGLGLINIAKKHSDEVVFLGWADSYIGKEVEFRRVLSEVESFARNFDGIILGVKPDYPATGFGYLEIGEEIKSGSGVYKIVRFEEKPNAERAAKFLQSNKHFWNPGISVWRVSSLLNLIKKHTPAHYEALQKVSEVIGTNKERETIEKEFQHLERSAIDTSIFEKAENLLAVPADLNWSDIGSWSAVYDVQSPNSSENVIRGEVVSVDTKGCLIYAQNRLVTTLGVSDLVIIETDDVVLIAHKKDAERLKELHAKVKTSGREKYL